MFLTLVVEHINHLRAVELPALDDAGQVVLIADLPRGRAEFIRRPDRMAAENFGLVQMRAGNSLIDLVDAEGPIGVMRGAPPGAAGGNMDHFCLRVSQFNEGVLLDKLRQQGVEGQVTGRIYGAQGFGPSIYFIDPQGNRVELKQHKDQSG